MTLDLVIIDTKVLNKYAEEIAELEGEITDFICETNRHEPGTKVWQNNFDMILKADRLRCQKAFEVGQYILSITSHNEAVCKKNNIPGFCINPWESNDEPRYYLSKSARENIMASILQKLDMQDTCKEKAANLLHGGIN